MTSRAQTEPRLSCSTNAAALDPRSYYGSSFDAIAVEAQNRGITVAALGVRSILVLTGFGRIVRMRGSISERTSQMAVGIADDKRATKDLLRANGIPVPFGFAVDRVDEAVNAWQAIGGAVAVKPHNGAQGNGVTVEVNDLPALRAAFHSASRLSRVVLVERFHDGGDFRIFVVNGAVVAAVQRVPAFVVGDGRRSIEELVMELNRDCRRGEGDERPMKRVSIDESVRVHLKRLSWTLDSVPGEGIAVRLRTIGSLSQGGHAIDCTDRIDPTIAALAVRSVALVGLDIAGVDIITSDITCPASSGDTVVLEVNCSPGLRAHLWPNEGRPRNPATAIIDYLFPESVVTQPAAGCLQNSPPLKPSGAPA